MSLLQKSDVLEGDTEIWAGWRHWKVPEKVDDDNEKALLLHTVILPLN